MELSEKVEESPTKQQEELKVNFLHINHSDKNLERVWQSAKNNDVILLETIDMSQEDRDESERVINSVSSEGSPLVRSKILANLYSNTDFISQIIRKVILEGKEFHYIDILDNDEAHKFADDGNKYQHQAFKNFQDGNFGTSFELFHLAIIAKAQSHNTRENLVSKQVSELTTKNAARWKGKQIGVIQGMSHSKTYGIFKRDNPTIKTSRSFLKEDRFVFPLHNETKKRLLHGSTQDRELTIKKSFLFENLIFPHVYSTSVVKDSNIENIEKISRSLSNDEVDSIFKRLSEIETFAKTLPNPAKQSYLYKHLDILAQQTIESYNNLSQEKQTFHADRLNENSIINNGT